MNMTNSLAFNYPLVLSFLYSVISAFIHPSTPFFLPSLILAFIHSFNQPINQSIIHSFNWFSNPRCYWLSLSVSKSEHPWILSLTWQRIYTLLSSEERFCIRSLQITRYTDPGDIWRKIKLRKEDTGSVMPATSSDGKPEKQSRLNVSVPSFFFIFQYLTLSPVM